jgi:hypothetical protein
MHSRVKAFLRINSKRRIAKFDSNHGFVKSNRQGSSCSIYDPRTVSVLTETASGSHPCCVVSVTYNRTSFHGGNTSSNPVEDAKQSKELRGKCRFVRRHKKAQLQTIGLKVRVGFLSKAISSMTFTPISNAVILSD